LETIGSKLTRVCKDCGLCSPNLELYVKDKGSKHGRRNLCIGCVVERNNKHPKQKDWKTNHQTMKRYGIPLEVYKERMATADKCEICKSPENLCYDHCHTTMKFRGVLCRSCNSAIGHLGDSLESIVRALNYLKEHTDD